VYCVLSKALCGAFRVLGTDEISQRRERSVRRDHVLRHGDGQAIVRGPEGPQLGLVREGVESSRVAELPGRRSCNGQRSSTSNLYLEIILVVFVLVSPSRKRIDFLCV